MSFPTFDIEKARKTFKDARMKTLVSYPFFGHILLGIDYVETDQVPTCGTDGVRYYWNPEFVSTVTVEEMIFNEEISYSKFNKKALDVLVRSGACDVVANGRFNHCRHFWLSVVDDRPKNKKKFLENIEKYKHLQVLYLSV